MIKWLTGAPRKSRQWVTDDPLATIEVPRPTQVYAVTRVNPIFIEEDVRKKGVCVLSGAGKSGSSGYESQHSSCGEDPPEDTLEHAPAPVASASPLSHGKSVLVAVPVLSTIPEGRIDYCIPRPIWPRYEGRQRKAPTVRVDGRRASKSRRRGETLGVSERTTPCPYDLLRELSTTIHLAADAAGRDAMPTEEILRDIGNRINKSLDALAAHNLSLERVTSEKVARKTSPKLTPADSESQRVSVSGGPVEGCVELSQCTESCTEADMEAGRLSLLRRLGRFPPCSSSGDPLYELARGGSTSTSTSTSTSSSSSSGFSDLTPTPPSSAALRPFGPVFIHDNPTSVPTRVRNTMIYESLQNRSPAGYEKLGERRIELDSQWTICEKTPCAEQEQKQISVFPKPDFTLDGHQAELLLRRLKAGKRQRCWCRLLTTALGLVFFLFSVMAVSMMLTNGKRMFGSL